MEQPNSVRDTINNSIEELRDADSVGNSNDDTPEHRSDHDDSLDREGTSDRSDQSPRERISDFDREPNDNAPKLEIAPKQDVAPREASLPSNYTFDAHSDDHADDHPTFKPRTNTTEDRIACETLTTFARAKPHLPKVRNTMRGCLVYLADHQPAKYRADLNAWLKDAYDMAVNVHQLRGDVPSDAKPSMAKPSQTNAKTKPKRSRGPKSVRDSVRAAIRENSN